MKDDKTVRKAINKKATEYTADCPVCKTPLDVDGRLWILASIKTIRCVCGLLITM